MESGLSYMRKKEPCGYLHVDASQYSQKPC